MRFDTVLIANRGEIAVRIIRACREQNLGCVSVYSTADRDALHVKFADRAVCIGAPATADSYLRMDSIIEACRQTGATAVHPGFGFLSENAEFAKLCRENDITFIGPSPECIAMLGDKAQAKETMKAAGVPVIPGSEGALHSIEEAKEIAKKIGYPVLVKASAGGGGRGIRRVDSEEQLEEQLHVAQEEAKKFFGDDTVYLEKLIVGPHHVEVQIIADEYGNTVALGERDCSMQRRNQKVLEESPSPLMTPELRDAMQKAAPVLLEPIMKVEVTTPEDYMGDVIGDINSRRGRIEGMEDIGGGKMIRGYVPLSEMFGYATDLRSRTQGRGNYSMFFEKYEQVPKSVQEKILSKKD